MIALSVWNDLVCGAQRESLDAVICANQGGNNMKIGYARTGALEDTGFQDQVSALKAAGCEKILKEACSSVEPRPKLDAARTVCTRETCSLSPPSIASRAR